MRIKKKARARKLDIMGEKERHKKTCSGFKPGTRNFSVTLTFESDEEMEEFFKDKKKK
ncbi:MAG: hypothetical protein ACP5N7_07360 [Candidatus Pacearchaeota archaeon]